MRSAYHAKVKPSRELLKLTGDHIRNYDAAAPKLRGAFLQQQTSAGEAEAMRIVHDFKRRRSQSHSQLQLAAKAKAKSATQLQLERTDAYYASRAAMRKQELKKRIDALKKAKKEKE